MYTFKRRIKDFLKTRFPRATRMYHHFTNTLKSCVELPPRLFVDETNIEILAHNWATYGLVSSSRFLRNERRFYYEEDIISHFKKMMREGGVFFDIGAHIGYWSILAAHRGAKKVVAFEPIYGLTRVLARAKREYGLPIEIVSRPVGEEGKEVALDNPHAAAGRETAVSVDEFVRRTGIVPTAMKIDVDGNEPAIIRGAMETLRAHRPDLFFEIREETAYLLSDLNALGYREVKRFGSDNIFVILSG